VTNMAPILLDRHRSGILHVRAISDEVIESWPERYQSFEAGDWETCFRLMQFDTSKWNRHTIASYKGMVTQSGGGIVITRRGLWTQTPWPPPYARLERDVSTNKGKKTHYLHAPDEKRSKRSKLYVPDATKRLDWHPKQPGRRINHFTLDQSDRLMPVDVYMCLEGSLKADAVLSAGHTVFSSTGVTTWKGRDLEGLIPLLRQVRTVYVVPDSDYMASDKYEVDGEIYFNPSVVYHTRMAAQWLANQGVNAKIAVPWAEEAEDGSKLGVDDYLALGYSMEGLRVEDAYANHDPVERVLTLTKSHERLLRDLMHCHGERGAFRVTKLARKLKMSRDTVLEGYRQFEKLGIMRVWEGFAQQADNGTWYTDPHWYVAYRLLPSYTDWLQSQPVPKKAKRAMVPWLRAV